jgi:hypothetical protein
MALQNLPPEILLDIYNYSRYDNNLRPTNNIIYRKIAQNLLKCKIKEGTISHMKNLRQLRVYDQDLRQLIECYPRLTSLTITRSFNFDYTFTLPQLVEFKYNQPITKEILVQLENVSIYSLLVHDVTLLPFIPNKNVIIGELLLDMIMENIIVPDKVTHLTLFKKNERRCNMIHNTPIKYMPNTTKNLTILYSNIHSRNYDSYIPSNINMTNIENLYAEIIIRNEMDKNLMKKYKFIHTVTSYIDSIDNINCHKLIIQCDLPYSKFLTLDCTEIDIGGNIILDAPY